MLTTHEAAERLGIKPRSVVALIRRGRLAAEKRGRDWFVEAAEVERYKSERLPAHRPVRSQVRSEPQSSAQNTAQEGATEAK